MTEIICKAEPKGNIGSMWKDNEDAISFRIIKSSSAKYYEGRTLDFGNMELAVKDGYTIILQPM